MHTESKLFQRCSQINFSYVCIYIYFLFKRTETLTAFSRCHFFALLFNDSCCQWKSFKRQNATWRYRLVLKMHNERKKNGTINCCVKMSLFMRLQAVVSKRVPKRKRRRWKQTEELKSQVFPFRSQHCTQFRFETEEVLWDYTAKWKMSPKWIAADVLER